MGFDLTQAFGPTEPNLTGEHPTLGPMTLRQVLAT